MEAGSASETPSAGAAAGQFDCACERSASRQSMTRIYFLCNPVNASTGCLLT